MSNVIYNTQKIEEKDEQLLKCTKCGKYNRLNASFCKGCGAKTAGTKTQVIGDKMTQEQESSFFEKYIICPSCNKTSIYKAKFCGKCGFNLDTIKQSFQSQEIGNKLHHKEYSFDDMDKLFSETKQLVKDVLEGKDGASLNLEINIENMGTIIRQFKSSSSEAHKVNTEKLSLINAIVRAVNQSLDLESIINNTLDKALLVTRSEAGIMMLIDEKSKKLVPKAFKGVSPVVIEELKQTTVQLDTGSHGRAYLLGKTVKAHASSSSPLTDALVMKNSLSSIVNVPLKSEREVVGIMSIGSVRTNAFTDEDMTLLDAIGNQIGIAIRNARLYGVVKNQVAELEEKNTKLKELEEMKNNLTQMIVHDLKNPLTGITGYIDLLLLESETFNEEQLMSINMICVSAKNLMRMILNLLDIGKMEEKKLILNKTIIDINEIIEKISDEFKPLLDAENKKIITLLEPVPKFRADKDLLYRIIANLVSNGISHSPPNNNIKIITYLNEEKTELIFSVEDKGIGIPEEYQEKIFDKFFQAEEKQKTPSTSRGLGLTFCKMAVEAHGGKIWVSSTAGKGSTFNFSIPL